MPDTLTTIANLINSPPVYFANGILPSLVNGQLIPGENAGGKTEYLEACLGRRKLLRLTGAGVGLAVAGSAYGTYRFFDA
jgi:hypothetical protein